MLKPSFPVLHRYSVEESFFQSSLSVIYFYLFTDGQPGALKGTVLLVLFMYVDLTPSFRLLLMCLGSSPGLFVVACYFVRERRK